MSEISKAYEPQSVEDKWYDFWLKQGCFTADPSRVSEKRPAYSIVIPPPNVTGMLHMGHVLNNTIQDILSRKARMDGKEVLWLPGTDHAGIATQVQVEKALKKEERKTKYDLGREEFLKRVWTWKEKHGGIIINQLKKLGCSCDWTRERFTMDPEYSRCVQKVFVELYKKGLIYRGKRMVNWCPVSQTALSDEEVEMKPQKGFMYHFKVQVAEEPDTWLTIATTRPETIPGDTAVAVNPKDTRYAHLIGKHIIRPLPIQIPREQKLIPIIGDEHVDFEFGTGVLKVTPAHDKADFEIGARHKLPLIDIMNPNGTMNDLAGESLAGLDRFEARNVAVDRLRELGALVEEKPYENNVGYSQRADVPIEPRLSEQWFLKYPAVPESKSCVKQDEKAPVSVWRNARWQTISQKRIPIIKQDWHVISGQNASEMRAHAWRFAQEHGFLNNDFPNLDSGFDITIQKSSIEHAFSNPGLANIKLIPSLPSLLRHALRVATIPHDPPAREIVCVHVFLAAIQLGHTLFSVKFTVKEFHTRLRLYDHQTVVVKKMEADGKYSPEEASVSGSFAPWPASVSDIKLADLTSDVNSSLMIRHQPESPGAEWELESDKMRFHPQRWAKVYDHWLTNIQDWCISRQLWWGHRIPVWTITLDRTTRKTVDGRELPIRIAKYYIDLRLDECSHSVSQVKDATTQFRVVADERTNSETIFAATTHDEEAQALESSGFIQDPDVLDTWFSSWLWPFATMGWPEKTPTLGKFYPTTDLVTGPDIIFFWVARMIMAGYEFMGDLPFKNVYFTGIIRDKQGRKMSKTLGNSPDPLVLISQYGADALRFGTMRSAPLGQDVLFDEKDVELGRNFCNKLWNACRFRQMQGSGAGFQPAAGASSPSESDGLEARKADKMSAPLSTFEVEGEIRRELLTSDDKWILLKLDQAIREVTTALAEYKFSDATAALYRFFWSEYCDWYVEASKATLYGSRRGDEADETTNTTNPPPHVGGYDAQKQNTLAVIDFILSNTLRLFHPFLPFITEELWQGMGFNKDLPAEQGGNTIMFAHWPKPLDDEFKSHYVLDETDEQFVNTKYELVTQGRNLRREGNIPSSKKVKFVFKPSGELKPYEAEVIKILLNAEAFEVNPAFTPKKGTPQVLSPFGELYLPLEGLIDVEAEKLRLKKELEKIDSEIAKVEQKLNNPAFTEKVPPPFWKNTKSGWPIGRTKKPAPKRLWRLWMGEAGSEVLFHAMEMFPTE